MELWGQITRDLYTPGKLGRQADEGAVECGDHACHTARAQRSPSQVDADEFSVFGLRLCSVSRDDQEYFQHCFRPGIKDPYMSDGKP
jgi:hypothetical protein